MLHNVQGVMDGESFPLLWDAHLCFPILPTADFAYLEEIKKSGARVVGINVGMDVNEKSLILKTLDHFRKILTNDSDIILIRRFTDIHRAEADGKLAVYLDFEGCNILEERPENVAHFSNLGVKQMVLAYKDDNSLGCSCSGRSNGGLSSIGKSIIQEMNRVGVIPDISHLNDKTSLDILQVSEKPVIASHSNPSGMKPHFRNASDSLIRAIAANGGVICVNGFLPYLAKPNTTTENYIDHIDYVCQLVGNANHIGIGLDYVVDVEDMIREYEKSGRKVTAEMSASYQFVRPAQYRSFYSELKNRSYTEQNIRQILGTNMLRVAQATWK